MNKIVKIFLLSVGTFASTAMFADVKPAALFSDNIVLQRDKPIPIWGTANAGEKVTITFKNTTSSTITDASGKWMLRLPKQNAGGPFTLLIEGNNKVVINDVYVGEVWLCSGQSNMDMTVATEDRYWCGVNNETEEVANANYPQMRVFDVDFTPSQTIKPDVTGKWEIVSPKTVGHLSAVAYFFARELYKKLHIPIGMITSAYGASTAETWISKEALEAHPNLQFILNTY